MPQKFRGRNGPYTSLDCYSTPYGTTQHLPTRQPAKYAQDMRPYEEAGSFEVQLRSSGRVVRFAARDASRAVDLAADGDWTPRRYLANLIPQD